MKRYVCKSCLRAIRSADGMPVGAVLYRSASALEMTARQENRDKTIGTMTLVVSRCRQCNWAVQHKEGGL